MDYNDEMRMNFMLPILLESCTYFLGACHAWQCSYIYMGQNARIKGASPMFQQIAVPLLAGLSIFLFGMKVMETALHKWAGPHLQSMLERFTSTPLRGMLTGAGMTGILQSSSAITVITIGLVNAGLMNFSRTLGIILGTNIGTCITTELIGLNINYLALPILYTSAAVWTASFIIKPLYTVRYISLAVGGFSMVLLGMEVMQSIVPELQSRGLFLWFLEQAKRSLVWGVLAGAALTAVIQSSSATIAIAMGLASVQAITVDLGMAVILGANVGTCVTAIIASIGGSKAGQLVAWSHTGLNVVGVLVFFPLLSVLQYVTFYMAETPSSQLAHAQTLFNVATSLLALPLCYLPFLRDRRF
jgi:phosphate:Na+ symporter